MVLNVTATNSGISLSPSSLSFGPQTILTPSPAQTVTYQNGTPTPVHITSVTFTGTLTRRIFELL